MSHTVSGIITSSGTRLPDGTLVSGSHYVNYGYSYVVVVSGIYSSAYLPTPPSDYCWLYTQPIGEPTALNPLDIRDGLIAWHSFRDTTTPFIDLSGNGYDAVDEGITLTVGKHGMGCEVSDFPTYGSVFVPVLPSGLPTYMCSFWFKPTQTLTSGTNQSFKVLSSEGFYGDHFGYSQDYTAFSPVRGWYLLNSAVKCQAGYGGTYLQLQGIPSSDWSGSTWNASTLFFNLNKNDNWSLETRVVFNPLISAQAFGIVFFDRGSYHNYCSIIIQNKGLEQNPQIDETPAMTSYNTPAGYVVASTSEWGSGDYNAWKAFDHVTDGYGWYSAAVSPPHAISFTFPSGVYINAYRFRAPNGTVTGLPQSWYLYGGDSSSSLSTDVGWTQLDYQSLLSPAATAGSWTAYYPISNPSAYQCYKMKIMSMTGSSSYTHIGEIELDYVFFVSGPADIKVQTSSFSYTVASDITMPNFATDVLLKATKAGTTISFQYRDPYNNYWIDTLQQLDCSLWGNNLAFGLQSHNSAGVSPLVYFDYVRFVDGIKPVGVGDAPVPGRFLVTYNKTSVSGSTGVRDDGRIWLQSDYTGVAYGTATHYWDPEQWYLMQAGVKSTGEYCWWVNGIQERGLVVGSGINMGNNFLTGSGMYYFDGDTPPSTSGSFILDEVSHWNRWLTGEEILKMINRVSQDSWFYTEGYHSSSLSLIEDKITVSGSYALMSLSDSFGFYYYGMYQMGNLPTAYVAHEKVSYRIQQSTIMIAQELNPFVVNIARCSSGWMANNRGCFGCLTSSGGNKCQCLVYEEVGIYTLGSPKSSATFPQMPRTKSLTSVSWLVSSTLTSGIYRQLVYDMVGPSLTQLAPAQNARMIDLNFDAYASNKGKIVVQDYGSFLPTVDNTRIWILRQDKGHHSFITEDNFSFYSQNFKDTPSGHGWLALNTQNSDKFSINDGYSSAVTLDYSRILISGSHLTIMSSGIQSSLDTIRKNSYRFNPTCVVSGTNSLNISTPSGSWSPGRPEKDAPFAYFLMPSGIADWEVKTKVNVFRSGNPTGQYAGLMLWNKDNPSMYYQLLATNSGIACRSHLGMYSPLTVNTGLYPTDDVWLKIKKTEGFIYYYWSPNGATWSGIEILENPINLVSPMTSDFSYPIFLSASTERTGHAAWNAFDVTITGTYWAPNGITNQWLMVDFTVPTTVYSYRFVTCPTYLDVFNRPVRCWIHTASLQGANNSNGPWAILHYLNQPTDPGPNAFVPNSYDYYVLPTQQKYRYYRFFVDQSIALPASSFYNNGFEIASLQLLGSTTWTTSGNQNFYIGPVVVSDRIWSLPPSGVSSTNYPAYTMANFDYMSITSSGGTGFTSIGDDWELLVDGITPLNSMTNSMLTSVSVADSETHSIYYQPLTPFKSGEYVYVRVQSHDTPSFKIDYDVTDYTLLYLNGDQCDGLLASSLLGSVNGVLQAASIFDQSRYGVPIYTYSGVNYLPAAITSSGYSGQGSISFTRRGLITDVVSASGLSGDWTFHTQLYPYSLNTAFQPLGIMYGNSKFFTSFSGNTLSVYTNTSGIGTATIPITASTWGHFALVKTSSWLKTFYNGHSTGDIYIGDVGLPSTGNIYLTLFDGYYGLADEIVFEKRALWTTGMYSLNYLDKIYPFKTVETSDLSITLNIINDTESPVIIPKSPLPYQQLICPSSGIEFEILDDFSGVKWTELLVKMNDITVWSGGNNMTEWFDDRGILTYEDLGKVGGEWSDIQLSPSGIDYIDGINRTLYPPGTAYSGSGAWGRRFSYHVPRSTEIGYFGSRMTVIITGTDSVGYLSNFDNVFPNTFSGQYYFDFIPNTNIRFDDVFMHLGQSMRIDEMEARGIHFWVDLFDSNYPVTDIVEDRCSITWTDGTRTSTCSGAWFTTWTGVTSSGDDVFFHRMHWDPGNHWNWIGNRSIQLTIESHNSDPTCDVYNREEYGLFYGWKLGWWHQAFPGTIPPFRIGAKIPIFVSVKTYDFAPSRGSLSWMNRTSSGYTFDLPVYLKPKPIPQKDLKVGILAQSQYLQYSEDVEVEVTCKDLDGNEMIYSWTFRTQDKPS